MFFRTKVAKGGTYLQLVENRREDGKVRQRVIATLGRADELKASGTMDSLLRSGARFAETSLILQEGTRVDSSQRRIGPPLLFERLWGEEGIPEALEGVLSGRGHSFSLERAVFLTVLHRLMAPGSDRAAEHWREGYRIDGAEGLDLHHLYRAMAWLGEPLPEAQQEGASPFAPRCVKDLVEESLFERRRHLFSSLSLVFFDTTSIYFEGEGGETVGEYGHSKDHRPDLRQMVVGLVLDQEGFPLCSEMWPGNTTDVTTLLPVLRRLKGRFGIGEVCLVSDRGMVSQKVLKALDAEVPKVGYILGARMRRSAAVKGDVLSRAGRFKEVVADADPDGHSPLKVKEVFAAGRRHIVCLNEDQARKDRSDRELILASLEKALKRGDKALIGNKGYRRYIKSPGGPRLSIDWDKAKEEARYDGKWVLVTNMDMPAEEVALQYKRLWMVEAAFRAMKTTLETRPIYHRCDETIRGHVFCSFLALRLSVLLRAKLASLGKKVEWERALRELDEMTIVEISHNNKCYQLRSEAKHNASLLLRAAGVQLPPTLVSMGLSGVVV